MVVTEVKAVQRDRNGQYQSSESYATAEFKRALEECAAEVFRETNPWDRLVSPQDMAPRIADRLVVRMGRRLARNYDKAEPRTSTAPINPQSKAGKRLYKR